MKSLLDTFGKRTKFAREAKAFSQKKLAKLANCSQQDISAIENDKVALSIHIFSIASALCVSAEWLYSGKERTAIAIINGYQETTIEDALDYPMIAHYCPVLTWEEAGLTIKRGDPELASKRKQRVPLAPHDSLNSYALVMQGNSMLTGDEKLISFMDGDILVFNPEKLPKANDYVLARVANERQAFFRQYVRDCGRHYLKANNSQYPVIRISDDVEVVSVWSTRYSSAK